MRVTAIVAPVLSVVLLYFGADQTPKTTSAPASAPSSSPVVSQGRLERQTIRYYVRLHQPAVRHCYVQELARRPDLRVDVAVDFTVAPTGSTSSCSAGANALGQCVARAVCGIRFPAIFDELQDGSFAPGRLSTQVRYRFRFQPTAKKGDAQDAQPSDPIARDRAADDADDPPQAQTSPNPPGTTTPRAVTRPRAKPASTRTKTRRGLLQRPATDDPLDGIDGGGDQL